jgi:hypothetical protein
LADICFIGGYPTIVLKYLDSVPPITACFF